ncbi:MAG: acyl-CoA carboxylase subunit beta [Nitrospirae bacterium]|nr:acyl-CoA carboxylase subunit beta [Nitrospirota bacterium]
MPVIESKINVKGESFAANAKHMEDYVRKVRDVEKKQLETETGYREKARAKGKLLPRERLSLLLDPGAPFLELCSIAGYGMLDDSDGSKSGGNIITGIGSISGRRCMVIVWNFAIKGGTINSVNVKKMLRIQEIVFQAKLPLVSLHESGGGDLGQESAAGDPWAAANFTDAGRVYGQQAELSAAGIPQITVAHGNATAGGAYQVALSDYIVLVKGKTQLFLAGPPLLKAGTGEETTHEELGGAEMHATVSGTGEYLAGDDADGIRIAREIVAQLPKDPKLDHMDEAIEPPKYDPSELIGLAPVNRRTMYKVQEVIARIVDGSEWFEFNPAIDQHTVCGHARIEGKRCGIIGNNGPITPKGALKAAQFIQLCEQARSPLLFLQNTTGFWVGKNVERSGQVKHSAKLIQAVANIRGPKITVLLGNSYGAGNYAMASRALKPNFVFSWPTARQALMGGAQAAKVIGIITEEKWKRTGFTPDDSAREQLKARQTMIEQGLEIVSESMYCSARLMDDGIIDPRDTRKVVSFVLDTCLEAGKRITRETSFGVPRL